MIYYIFYRQGVSYIENMKIVFYNNSDHAVISNELEKTGFHLNAVPQSEIYSTLQRGIVDGVLTRSIDAGSEFGDLAPNLVHYNFNPAGGSHLVYLNSDQVFSYEKDISKGIAAAYDFLLDGVPNQAGFVSLINSAVSSNFGAGPGSEFNQENIFINLVNNLIQGNDIAGSKFASIALGDTLESKLAALYQNVIPPSKQTTEGLQFFTRPDGIKYYSDVAAERGVAGIDGAAITALAALLKIVVVENIGIGNSVNDLIAAVNQGSAVIPATGTTLTALETADGTQFDNDDAATSARTAAPQEITEAYASSSEVNELAFGSPVSIMGVAGGYDGDGSF